MSMTLSELQKPLPAWTPKAWYYGAARAALALGALISDGMAIGRRHGFDSGLMLDYVYANRASGLGALGRMLDRIYLDAPGWAGIRNRGALLKDIVAAEIRARAVENRPVRLADIAAGGGRYLIGALAEARGTPVDAVLRDYEAENVERARANAAAAGVAVTAETGDAFCDRDLAALGRRDIVVVSGLHEIVDDDATVYLHFRQLRRVVADGGALILTVQPDHPQAEFMARALTSHTGRPWAMRLRDTGLTYHWLMEAGFDICSLTMEESGIFGVIVATPGLEP